LVILNSSVLADNLRSTDNLRSADIDHKYIVNNGTLSF
jgi:hypothetical protein